MTPDSLGLTGRVVVVTGGTGAIGGAIARALAEAGARAVVIARNVDALPSLDRLHTGVGVVAVAADVLEAESLESACRAILEETESIRGLVNCAGGNVPAATVPDEASPFDLPIDALRAVVDLNLVGTVLPSHIFGPSIGNSGGGAIVNVSSVAAGRALTRVGGYGAAKAAMESYTRWLAVELGRRRVSIRVNAVMPGFVVGDQNRSLLVRDDGQLTERAAQIVAHTPLSRLGLPEDIASAVLWLLSDGAGFVTGALVPVDGGFSAAAGV